MTTKLLTLRAVIAMTALLRSAIYAPMAESRYPTSIWVGARTPSAGASRTVADFIAISPPSAGIWRFATPAGGVQSHAPPA